VDVVKSDGQASRLPDQAVPIACCTSAIEASSWRIIDYDFHVVVEKVVMIVGEVSLVERRRYCDFRSDLDST
jgi:hypothetical protein